MIDAAGSLWTPMISLPPGATTSPLLNTSTSAAEPFPVATAKASNGLSEFTLAHDPDSQAMTVRLTAACTTSGATPRPADQPRARRYERTNARSGQVTWYTVFPGGCITYHFRLSKAGRALVNEASLAVSFILRPKLDAEVRRVSDGRDEL